MANYIAWWRPYGTPLAAFVSRHLRAGLSCGVPSGLGPARGLDLLVRVSRAGAVFHVSRPGGTWIVEVSFSQR